jgi:CheY-like chemotaxis protein
MDIMMPEMNGYEATRKIRASDHPKASGVPIVALTALTDNIDVAAAKSAGMNEHIGKPIDEKILFKILRQLLLENNEKSKDELKSEENVVKTVFIVDDNDTNLMMAENALEEHYNVLTIPSASGMFDLLKRVIPNLILLDIAMPEMDGFEAMQILKSSVHYADIPVIFLTGKNDEAMEEAAFEMGAVDLIQKPFHTPVLLKRVEYHLEFDELVRERAASLSV